MSDKKQRFDATPLTATAEVTLAEGAEDPYSDDESGEVDDDGE